MKTLTLEPIRRIDGEIQLPGSKSMTNRLLLLASLAEGTTEADVTAMCEKLLANTVIESYSVELA